MPIAHLPPAAKAGSAYWAQCAPEDALSKLGSFLEGLSADEATRRLQLHGFNSLPHVAKSPWYVELSKNFIHLFALLLWAGAALSWVAGMPQLAWAIIIVIIVNGLFSFWQEFQAERAAEALAALLPHQVTVRRDGTEQRLSTTEIVPGDILILTEGEAIPADARLLKAERLRIDASSLTGESRPVPRSIESAETSGKTGILLPNLVFAGTSVVSGYGEAVVFATAAATEFGHIAQLTQAQDERMSPLQQELQKVTTVVTILAVGFGILFFLVGTLVGGLRPIEGFLFAVGIIVANVPEGLLPTLTLALALGVRRMAQRNALVKRLSAVETLGATTVILTDKTGTLTENEMTIREVWTSGTHFTISGVGYGVEGVVEPSGHEATVAELLRTAALCCDARLVPPHAERPHWSIIGDPMEAAILVAATKVGLREEKLAAWPRLVELPFDSTRKRMTIIHQIDGQPVACVKGAPSQLLARSSKIRWNGATRPFDDAHRQTIQAIHDTIARRGLRLLGVAVRELNAPDQPAEGWQFEEVESDLTFLGLLAMEDPPRPEVPAALAACREAKIQVVMVTGDNGLTATAIAQEIGMYQGEVQVITGDQLDHTSKPELLHLLDNPNVLIARATPEHKLRLVEAFQQRGEVVAVTGDGVNDAPALKRADIGVAMGMNGTDVAREAADIVLADDNFASIIEAIREGRAVYENVRKFITYIFASNSAEMMPFVAFILFRIPLPLTIMQVLAIDIGTDLVPAIALGAEPPEADTMHRPPRSRQERLLNISTLIRAYLWFGLIEAVFGFVGFFWIYHLAGWRPGMPLEDSGLVYILATTMTLAGIVAGQVGNAFACRSSSQSVLKLGLLRNRFLLGGIAVELGLLLAMIYLPPLAHVFGTAPLGVSHWLFLAALPVVLLVLEEGRKFVVRSFFSK